MTEHVGVADPDYATMDAIAFDYPDVSEAKRAGEVMARMAETGVRPTFLEVLYARMRNALRALGINLKYTNAELKTFVIDAAKLVRDGKQPRDAQGRWTAEPSFSTPGQQLELEMIKARYFGTPLWMKAPNGQPTKLNERQWLQVHTAKFKQWFGDWEKLSFREFLEGNPVIELTGNEFQPVQGSLLSKRVAEWFSTAHNGRAKHPVLGNVTLDERAAKSSIGHGLRREKAAAFAAVPAAIQGGRIIQVVRGTKQNDADRYVIAAPIRLKGEDYILEMTVVRDVNIQRMFVHEVVIRGALRPPFKTGAVAQGQRTGGGGALMSMLHDTFSVNPDTVSKTVNENGEPLVVYHGTGKDIAEFEVGKNGAASTGNITAVWGSFFTPSAAEASRYVSDFHKDGQNVVPVFLSLKNPLEMTRGEWDRHAMKVYRGMPQEQAIAEERAFADQMRAEGYDGVIVSGRGFNAEYIAFEPGRIKSAIGNNGDFDGSKGNILESRAPVSVTPRGTMGNDISLSDRILKPLVSATGIGSRQRASEYFQNSSLCFSVASRAAASASSRERPPPYSMIAARSL